MPYFYPGQELSETKNYKTHYDTRKLLSKGYSALYWFILSSVLYYKTYTDYPWLSLLPALYALDNGVNMVHYFNQAYCAAHQEDKTFDFLKEYILFLQLNNQS